MTGQRRNRYGKTLEQRVWHWLGGHPNCRVSAVMKHFDIDRNAASQCLRRLLAKESVVRVGKTLAVRYTATSLPPDDFRGTAINTLLVLQKHTCAKRTNGIRIKKP